MPQIIMVFGNIYLVMLDRNCDISLYSISRISWLIKHMVNTIFSRIAIPYITDHTEDLCADMDIK